MAEKSLHDYLLLARSTPSGDFHFHATMAETNEEYAALIKRGLKLVCNELVLNRRHKQDHSEDALNVEIASSLRLLGLPAIHDAKYGGHTDLSVRLGEEFVWIAEAKKWKGCAWAFSGLKQLARYMSGLPHQDNGALILYIFDPDAAALMETWRLRLEKLVSRVTKITQVNKLSFNSSHKHNGAGTDVTVDHIALPLYWDSAATAI